VQERALRFVYEDYNSSVLKWSGMLFHNVGAANLKDFLPYRVDLICGISKMLLYLKEYLEFFIWTSWNGSKCRCSACRWLKFCFWFAYILIFLFFIS
jgi:hypothetical protein